MRQLVPTLFLLAAVFVHGQCLLLGNRKCTWGPSYWCSHLHHAKDCGAVQHCLTTVWANQKQGMVGTTETCFDIIRMLDAARKSAILGDRELLRHMAMACTGFPVGKRAVCQEFVNNDQKELMVLLKSDLSSKAVASALGFCSGFEDFVPHPVMVQRDYCTDCLNFFGDLREIFNNSETQIVALLKQEICASLKYQELINICDQLVDNYVGIAYNIVYQQMNPQDICTILTLCTNASRVTAMQRLGVFLSHVMGKIKSGEECLVCLNVTKILQDALRDANVQKELIDGLENDVCPLLPGTMAAECKSYVTEYAPLIFQVLVSELDPETFCENIKLCPASAAPLGHIKAIPQKLRGLPTCAICEEILKKLEEMLPEKTLEQDVVAALDQVCSRLTGDMSTRCEAFVQEYGPKIIEIIMADGPAAVCTVLGLCVGQKHLTVVALGSSLTSVRVMGAVKDKNTAYCALCEVVVTKLYKDLADNKTQAAIEKALETACNVVPAEYVAECTAYVQQNMRLLIELIEVKTTPEAVCTRLGLCSQRVSAAISPVKKTSDITCELCKIVVGKVEEMLEQHSTQEEIEQELDKLCSVLPDSASCKQLVNEYLPTIILLLEQELSPDVVCQQLSLCTASGKVAVGSEKMKGSDASCELCKFVSAKLDEVLEQNVTQAEILDMLVKACGHLEGDLNAQCISFVHEYGPMVIELIAQEISSGEICSILKLCVGKVFHTERPRVAARTSDGCLVCKEIVNYLNLALEDPSVEKDIEEVLLRACTYLPTDYQSMCHDFIQQYYPQLVVLLTEKDQAVCTIVHLCTNTTQVSKPVQKSSLIFEPMLIHKPLIGQEKCTYGPSYWCASKENARLCNVPIERCIQMKLMKRDDE